MHLASDRQPHLESHWTGVVVVVVWWSKLVGNSSTNCSKLLKCQVHIGEKGHAWPGWTTSRCGQDSPWMSQSEWQTTGINGESTSMMWPTLGSRAAKEHNSSVSFQWQENWMPENWSYVSVAYDYRCCGCRESAGITDCSTTPGWCCLSHWWAAAVSNLLFCNVEQCFSEKSSMHIGVKVSNHYIIIALVSDMYPSCYPWRNCYSGRKCCVVVIWFCAGWQSVVMPVSSL